MKPAATLEKLMSRLLGMCLLTLPLLIVPVLAQDSARWHDPSKHSVRFVTVEEGVQLEVLDWGGTGRPVVLLAGRGFTAHVFDGFAEKLTDSIASGESGLKEFQFLNPNGAMILPRIPTEASAAAKPHRTSLTQWR
jgi:hypothetical protein